MKIFFLASLLAAASAIVRAESLDLKAGAWETTLKSSFESATFPPEVLAQMKPETRADIEKTMAEREGKVRTETKRSCMKKKDLESLNSLFEKNGENDGGECKLKVIESSSRKITYEKICTGEGAGTEKLIVDMKSPELFVVTRDLVTARSGKMHMEITARWLGTSCSGIND